MVPDLEQRLPGRGLWVQADRAALDRAVAKGLFSRAARATVRADADLANRVEELLLRRVIALMGLARRAGAAVTGFEKVRDWLKTGSAAVLLAASDGAEDGRGKLRGLAEERPIIALLSATELGEAFGRDRAVHAAIAPGGFAEKIVAETGRLAGFRRLD